MPLQLNTEMLTSDTRTSLILGKDILVKPCSGDCLLNSLPPTARCVVTGQTSRTRWSILADEHLLLALEQDPRQERHVLGAQKHILPAQERWKRLLGVSSENLMQCLEVCGCMVKVNIVPGIPLLDANTVPGWQRARLAHADIMEARWGRVEYPEWAGWMAGLCRGMAELHDRGLSHGDPFPFNVIVNGAQAVWVDFGNLTDDPAQVHKDIWGFVFFTLLFTAEYSSHWSPSLLQHLCRDMGAAKPLEMMRQFALRLDMPRKDLLPLSPGDAVCARMASLLIRSGLLTRKGSFAREGLRLVVHGLPGYFRDFLHYAKDRAHWISTARLENLRHKLVEDETIRLMAPRVQLEAAQKSAEATQKSAEEAMRRDRESFESALAELRRQVNDLSARIQTMVPAAELEAARQQHQRRVAELTDQIAAMVPRTDLEAARQRHERRVAELTDQIAAMVPRTELEAARQRHQRRVAELTDQIAAMVPRTELEAARQQHERRVAELTDQIAAMVPRTELEAALKDAQSKIDELAGHDHAQEASLTRTRDSLLHAEAQAHQLIGLIEQFKLHKTFRLARLVKLVRHELLGGPWRQRARFLGRLARRMAGGRGPISLMNPLDVLTESSQGVLSTIRASQSQAMVFPLPSNGAAPAANTAGSTVTPPTVSGAADNVPYIGIRAPHGRRRVAILTNQLVDWFDRRPRFGGGERYAITIARLLTDLGLQVQFFQPASEDFTCEYYGFPVIAFRQHTERFFSEFAYENCTRFTELAADYDHVLMNMPEYCSGTVRDDAILVFHGIWFDHNNVPCCSFRTPLWYQHLERVFRNPRRIVSVDTNSINYVRAVWPDMAGKMTYIPNTFDPQKFHPDSSRRKSPRLTVLFPRRGHINRGSRILADILSRVPHDVRFQWVGEGDAADTQLIQDLCRKDRRLSYQAADFEQMPGWYQAADITVIPTIACEGTSYSCIEALACGSAVISTNVGGLTDLVHPQLNGMLVDPTAAALAGAINRLIEDPQERRRLQEVGPCSMDGLQLKHWRRQWTQVLLESGWTDMEHARNVVSEPELRAMRPSLPPDGMTRLKDKKIGIVTKNAIHGGVESIVAVEQAGLGAQVIVAGGIEQPGTCPFPYVRADTPERMAEELAGLDAVLYHWPPHWAVQAIRESGVAGVEFVHRTDTADCDKSTPNRIVTHSSFLAEYIYRTFGRPCDVIEHPINTQLFRPPQEPGCFIGALAAYEKTKGLDIFLQAWKQIGPRFKKLAVRFYGSGNDESALRGLANDLNVKAEFLPPTSQPHEALAAFRCVVLASRIEGLPMAALEALAMNIPVVASDLPGMVEFNQLARKRGFAPPIHLFEKENPSAMAKVLQQVLSTDKRPDTRSYIEQFYGTRNHVSEIARVLAEAIDDKKRNASV